LSTRPTASLEVNPWISWAVPEKRCTFRTLQKDQDLTLRRDILSHIIHKFQAYRPATKEGYSLRAVSFADLPAGRQVVLQCGFYLIKRQKPRNAVRMSSKTMSLLSLRKVHELTWSIENDTNPSYLYFCLSSNLFPFMTHYTVSCDPTVICDN
jgi:hypothetical protein